ncbi:MAG: hypothetical protein KKC37_11455, partial [Proteobacteria bacterium]|nr:hypothetical protein [Pseudomonadota bacterium]
RRAVDARVGQSVRLQVKRRPGTTVSWRQIVPHVDKRYNNAGWPWDPNAYKWLGYARIEYRVTKIEAWRNKWAVTVFDGRRAVTTWPWPGAPRYFHRGVGSFWFQVVIRRHGRVVARSAGVEDGDRRGLSPAVLRLSVRRGPGLVGFVSGFFNVPAVFGATPYQSRHFIGVDCAEVIMAAWHWMKGRQLRRDYNVAMLTRIFPARSRFNLSAGAPDRVVRWGRDVRPGDLIAVRYAGARFFQHVGVMLADKNNNGRLDAHDLVLHVGPDPLAATSLGDGPFDGYVLILRPG